MKKSLIQAFLFFILSFSTVFSQSILEDNIYFDSDEYVLTDGSELVLNDLIEEVRTYTEFTLHIIGHTDQDGSIDYNLELSKKRAESVKQFFIARGIEEKIISVSFHGESHLAYQSLDAESKKQNRRVAILANGFDYQNAVEMVSQLMPDHVDKHSIDQNTKSNFVLSQGTEVTIPANSFCHLDGTPLTEGNVDVTFKEAFEYLDMVDERLFTQTDDQLLETGGMIYIEASQNGQPVRIKEGKSIELLLPAQELKDGMELFTGAEDDNGIIWEETGEEITSVKEKPKHPPVRVDLSPLLDFVFADQDVSDLNYGEMIPYPHPARKAYPPFEDNYTEEGYQEALQKYHAVMDAYEADKIDRPERLEEWKKEVEKRKSDIYKHKKYLTGSKVREKVKLNLVRLEAKKDEICHDRLTSVLFNFLDEEVGRVGYDEWYYLRKAFGKGLGDVVAHGELDMPDFRFIDRSQFCLDFMTALKEVKNNIEVEKIEMGIADVKTTSRYLMKASRIGWMNCDRFKRMKAEEKMNLQFASISEDAYYYLVFKNMKSLIRPKRKGGNIVFTGIPKGEEVRLVGVNMQDGNAFIASQDFKLDPKVNVNMRFASAEIKDLKKVIEDI